MNQDNMHIVFLCPKSTSSPVNFSTALNLAANSDDWLTQATSSRLNIFELLVWFPFTKHRNKPRSKMPPGPRVSKHQADHSNVEGNVHDDGDRHAQQRLFILLHSRLWPARNALWKWTVEFDLLEIFAAWALSSTLDDILFLSRCLLWCRHVQNWGIFRRIPEIGAAILGQGSYGVVSWPEGRALSGWRTRAQSVALSVIRGVCVVSNSVQFADCVFQKSGQILMIVCLEALQLKRVMQNLWSVISTSSGRFCSSKLSWMFGCPLGGSHRPRLKILPDPFWQKLGQPMRWISTGLVCNGRRQRQTLRCEEYLRGQWMGNDHAALGTAEGLFECWVSLLFGNLSTPTWRELFRLFKT